jgi:hypothetical protein
MVIKIAAENQCQKAFDEERRKRKLQDPARESAHV